jgi:oligopeptide transport system substrate-binding protein
MSAVPRARWLAGLAAIALVAAACSSGGKNDSENSPTPGASDTGTKSGGVISVNASEPQNPLVPSNTNEVGGGNVLDTLFKGLVDYDPKGNVRNQVAESIESSDGQHYTVKLKQDWKFTNGEPVIADNFIDAWNYGAYEPNAQLNSWWYEPIAGYEDLQCADHNADDSCKGEPKAKEMSGLKKVDDYTFTIELTAPQATFPLQLGYVTWAPLPKVAFEDMAKFGENPIGNGPYKLDSWEHNVQIKVVKNPDFKGDPAAKNDGVIFKIYQSQDAAYADLLAGNLDVLTAIPSSAFATFESELGDRAINQPAGIFQSFTFPLYQKEWQGENGKKLRHALSMAIDRESITKAIFQGTRSPAKDFSSPVVNGFDENICGELCTYQPEKAKALLTEAGGFKGTLGIAYNADGGHKEWVDAVCNSITNTLGVKCEGKAYPDFKSLRADVTAGKMTTAFRTGWQMDYPGLDNFLGPLYSAAAGANDARYNNPAFEDLLKKGNTASSPEEAIKFFQDAEKILAEDMPAVPLWNSNATGGYAKGVNGVEFDVFSVPVFSQITK